jgi:hypothetical protein
MFNQTKSKYAQHILEFIHEYGTIESKMEIIKAAQMSGHLDIVERFHIYKVSKNKPKLNEQYATDTNMLFFLIIKRDKTKCINK